MATPTDDDDFLFILDDDDERLEDGGSAAVGRAAERGEGHDPWRLLLVDDDPAVHEVTRLALRGLEVRGRPCVLISATSGLEARTLLKQLPAQEAVAVAIVDVVMETETAGTDLVRWMRTEASLSSVRIVIRTGQPGVAPEEELLRDLDINDYWSKTEMTARRMRTVLVGLIRSYRDLRTLERQRAELRRMITGLGDIQSHPAFHEVLEGLLGLIAERLEPAKVELAFLELPAGRINGARVLMGTGRFHVARDATLDGLVKPGMLELLRRSRTSGSMEQDGAEAAFLHTVDGTTSAAFVASGLEHLDDWSTDTLSLLCGNALSLINTLMVSRQYETLSRAAARFVPTGLTQLLGAEDLPSVGLDSRRTLSGWVMFCDLRGFTSMTEVLGPSATHQRLHDVFGRLVPRIRAHGGVVDKFTGDGLLAVFPTEVPPVACCLELERAVSSAPELDGLVLSIGLHGGSMLLCTLGYEDRLDVTVIGDTVNVAARIESHTRAVGCRILVSDAVVDAMDPATAGRVRPVGRHRLRGRTARVGLAQVMTDTESLVSAPAEVLEAHLAALVAEHPSALQELRNLAEAYPRDLPLRQFAFSSTGL